MAPGERPSNVEVEMESKPNRRLPTGTAVGVGIAAGVGFGLIFASLFNWNIGMAIAIGAGFGLIFGTLLGGTRSSA
jgi:xanthine/uracil/vitamin C permease (AzgA family)